MQIGVKIEGNRRATHPWRSGFRARGRSGRSRTTALGRSQHQVPGQPGPSAAQCHWHFRGPCNIQTSNRQSDTVDLACLRLRSVDNIKFDLVLFHGEGGSAKVHVCLRLSMFISETQQ